MFIHSRMITPDVVVVVVVVVVIVSADVYVDSVYFDIVAVEYICCS